jgi:tetratricopeptide (TPR) repeat protein
MTRPAPTPGSPREIALRMAGQREFSQAVLWLDRALAAASGSDEIQAIASALCDVARAAEEAGDLEAAHRALERAVLAVEWADVFCQLGCLLVRRGRRSEAREAFDRALALNPRYLTAVVERALLDARDGRIAQAMETLRVLAAERPVREPAALEQGLERLGQAEFEAAAPLLRRALDGGDRWLEEQLGAYQSLVFAGDAVRALATLRAAALERPTYADLQLLLGAHEMQLGAVDDAIESLTNALEINPAFHAARVELARALELLGDTPQALAQLGLVLEADPGHSEARGLQGRLEGRRRPAHTADAAA